MSLKQATPEPAPSTVKNHKGAPVTRAVPNAITTLAGIAMAMSRITAADLAYVPDEVRATWAKDLTGALSKLRAARDLIKETK